MVARSMCQLASRNRIREVGRFRRSKNAGFGPTHGFGERRIADLFLRREPGEPAGDVDARVWFDSHTAPPIYHT